jgi:hypothetical protein
VDRHRVDADPSGSGSFLPFDSEPDPDPDWHKNNAHADANPKFYTCLKIGQNYSQQCQFTMFFFCHQWPMTNDFKYFRRHKNVFLLSSMANVK